MRVDKRKRQVAEAREGIDAQVAYRLVGKPVRAVARDPLRHRRTHNHERKLLQQRHERGNVNVSGRDHAVDCTANHDGHVELEDNRDGRRHKGGNQRHPVRLGVGKQAARDLGGGKARLV